jgi:hypothetical protein
VRVEDLTVEVRNKSLERVGQLSGADLVGAEFILRHNEVGSWKVTLHSTSTMADLLRTPGYGLIVTGPDGVIMSGPMLSASLVQTQDDVDGSWTIEGFDDSIILAERLAYPDPAVADVTAQSQAYDIRNDAAETVLKEYVNENLVSGPSIRVVTDLTVATDVGSGETVYGSARFDKLQELFYGLAQSGGVGYTIEQQGAALVFDVYQPVDRSALIRFDIDNGRLTSADYAYSAPSVTRAIVGGAGEQEERLFFEGTLTQSTDAETLWGRRIESFVDARTTQESDEFTQVATEALVDEGKTRVAMTVTPTDNTTMLFGSEWGLGDTITVTVRDIVATAVVYTVALSIQSDGVYLAAEVGTPMPVSYEAKLSKATLTQAKRLGDIERNTTGYGVVTTFSDVSGGTDGTQPTFSGPVFTATYTRFGDMIHFSYTVDFTNILTFGTGQYFMTLPYNARRDYVFRDGRLTDDNTSREYHITGTVSQGSNVMILWTTDRQGNRIFDFPFSYNEPITLTTSDSFSIAGTYELEQ